MVVREETEVVLRWLRDNEASGGMVFDSDLMRSLQWTLAVTQAALRELEEAGDIECRLYVLGHPTGQSLGDIHLTRHGRARLEKEGPAPTLLGSFLGRLLALT